MADAQPPEYAVHLDSFEGPLDLLLRLIEKAELDITTISLARVTDQYLAYIRQLDEIHPDLLADFLVVAAKLLLIKSRALLPQPPKAVEDEEDIGQDLVRQLEEYKRFKAASLNLREREAQGLRSYVRLAPPPTRPKGLAPGEVSLADLLAALQRVLVATPTVPVSSVVAPVVISIDDKMRAIEAAIASSRRVHFAGLLMRAHSRIEVVVTFLAILELIKRGTIQAEQDAPFGEIYIAKAAESQGGPAADDGPAS